jgi:hypothetical protein
MTCGETIFFAFHVRWLYRLKDEMILLGNADIPVQLASDTSLKNLHTKV